MPNIRDIINELIMLLELQVNYHYQVNEAGASATLCRKADIDILLLKTIVVIILGSTKDIATSARKSRLEDERRNLTPCNIPIADAALIDGIVDESCCDQSDDQHSNPLLLLGGLS